MALAVVKVAKKPIPRSGHIAARIGENLLVWGGYTTFENSEEYFLNDKYLPEEEVWIFRVGTDRWKRVKTNGVGPPGMSGATAIAVGDSLYIVGGHFFDGNTCETYRLNFSSCTWHHIKIPSSVNKFSPRDKFTGWHYQNRLYIFGGYGYPLAGYLTDHGRHVNDDSTYDSRGWNDQLLCLDLATPNTWHNPKCLGDVPLPRASHATERLDDDVYLFGGRHDKDRLNDLHILHMPSLVWRKVECEGLQPEGRSWHSFTAVSQKDLFLYGGYSTHSEPLSDGWLLDTETLQWTAMELSDTLPRVWHTACSFSDGEVLIFGGCCNDILRNRATEHSADILEFFCSPKSLFRLCLEVALRHRDVLKDGWNSLPTSLSNHLKARLPEVPLAQDADEEQEINNLINVPLILMKI